MRRTAASVAVLLFCLAGAASAEPAAVQRREVGNQILENVPDAPAEVREGLRRYQNARGASFQDWLPDGSMLVTTRFGSTNQLHRVVTPGADRTQLTFFDEPVAGAQTVPGSDRFVFTKDKGGDEWFQLHLAGLDGRDVALTEAGTRNQGLVFSPDHRTAIWSRQVKGSANSDIVAVDLAAPAAPRVLFKGEGQVQPLDVSPDGRTVLLGRYFSAAESKRYLLDLSTGVAKELAASKDKIAWEGGVFTPDGKSVLMLSDRGSDVKRLVRLDLATAKETVLTPDLKWGVESFDLSEDGGLLAYAVNEDGYSKVSILDLRTGRALAQPQLPTGVIGGLEFSPDGGKLAIGLSTPSTYGDVWSWDVAAARLDRWTNSELGGLDAARLVEPQLARFKSFDGLSVPAFVYKPKGATGKLPVIIDIHGGPESQTRPGFNAGAQYFAGELGVAVIQPNVRGSDGYGKTYLSLDNAEKREDSVKDIGALLDWVKTQPDLDPERVVVYGQSYGGYMSLAVMTHYSDRLAGGVERYGISNFVSFLENTEAYRRDLRRVEYGDERDAKMRAVFEKISPLKNVAKITKPMLVMQGSNDPRVPQSESDQVVRELRANGVDTWYVVFKDEGHGFLKKANNDRRREAEALFLQKVLGLGAK
ncbi:S9 family peptidase [Caulobacter sp. 17J65-9]|uniref:S9 family peptidase n=1 Tax=Caulobacter sp. 17J65-9 TaxID=2709382 RepID=UPI0013C5573D|nr:S9 family peptidase [Caulobacter sp. 17J65-9]NEX93521.1 S9 family peptidase [Caulobacter sp. 17J65-9]